VILLDELKEQLRVLEDESYYKHSLILWEELLRSVSGLKQLAKPV